MVPGGSCLVGNPTSALSLEKRDLEHCTLVCSLNSKLSALDTKIQNYIWSVNEVHTTGVAIRTEMTVVCGCCYSLWWLTTFFFPDPWTMIQILSTYSQQSFIWWRRWAASQSRQSFLATLFYTTAILSTNTTCTWSRLSILECHHILHRESVEY